MSSDSHIIRLLVLLYKTDLIVAHADVILVLLYKTDLIVAHADVITKGSAVKVRPYLKPNDCCRVDLDDHAVALRDDAVGRQPATRRNLSVCSVYTCRRLIDLSLIAGTTVVGGVCVFSRVLP